MWMHVKSASTVFGQTLGQIYNAQTGMDGHKVNPCCFAWATPE